MSDIAGHQSSNTDVRQDGSSKKPDRSCCAWLWPKASEEQRQTDSRSGQGHDSSSRTGQQAEPGTATILYKAFLRYVGIDTTPKNSSAEGNPPDTSPPLLSRDGDGPDHFSSPESDTSSSLSRADSRDTDSHISLDRLVNEPGPLRPRADS